LSVLLHCAAGLLGGMLAHRLSGNSQAGLCAAGLFLLHPRAALGTSLIYNFYDPLLVCLMMVALLCLWSLRESSGHRLLKGLGLWTCTGVALGMKEVALPMVLIIVLADWLWEPSAISFLRAALRHTVPIALLTVYLLARWRFVGRPFHTHGHPTSFPLPTKGEEWALFWDALLLVTCALCAFVVHRWARSRASLPKTSAWMLLWCGLMLWPAVHFCSQVNLRPWFFDQRYWYVPLAPLSVLTGSLLARGGMASAALGSGALFVTVPGPWSLFVAAMVFVIFGPLRFQQHSLEMRALTGTLLAAAMALLVRIECQKIRLRADDAARVRSEIAKTVRADSGTAVALLNFSESTIEQRLPFNGDLQWLLQPPFFKADLNGRVFFAYSTWDMPPTNRFRDRLTSSLAIKFERGERVNVYRWDEHEYRLQSVGEVTQPKSDRSTVGSVSISLMEAKGSAEGRRWVSRGFAVDGKIFPFVALRMMLSQTTAPRGKGILFKWKQPGMEQPQSLQLLLPEDLKFPTSAPIETTVWVSPGSTVDWLAAPQITGLEVETDLTATRVFARLEVTMPADVFQKAHHLKHYRNPATKFEQVAESWWVWE
jgi:hypothetical protein